MCDRRGQARPDRATISADLAAEVGVQPDAIVSARSSITSVTVAGRRYDAGQGSAERTAARAAIVQVLPGRLRFTVDGQDHDAGPGFWPAQGAAAPTPLSGRRTTVVRLALLEECSELARSAAVEPVVP